MELQILDGRKEITWIIGGPLGLAPSVIEHADLVLSFSKLTFPHLMMRLILLEQIYRSFRIIHREPYHRWGEKDCALFLRHSRNSNMHQKTVQT